MLIAVAEQLNSENNYYAEAQIVKWDAEFRQGIDVVHSTGGIKPDSSYKFIRQYLEQKGFAHIISASVAHHFEHARLSFDNPLNKQLLMASTELISQGETEQALPSDAVHAIEARLGCALPEEIQRYLIRDCYLRQVTRDNLEYPELDGQPLDPFDRFVGDDKIQMNYQMRLDWLRATIKFSFNNLQTADFACSNVADLIPSLDFEDGFTPDAAMITAIQWQVLIDYMRDDAVANDDFNYILQANSGRQGDGSLKKDRTKTDPIHSPALYTPTLAELASSNGPDLAAIEQSLTNHLGFVTTGDAALVADLLTNSNVNLAVALSDMFMIDIEIATNLAEALTS